MTAAAGFCRGGVVRAGGGESGADAGRAAGGACAERERGRDEQRGKKAAENSVPGGGGELGDLQVGGHDIFHSIL